MTGGTAMELEKKTLESIGQYVKKNLGTWLAEAEYGPPGGVLLERLIRLEEELKAQRGIMGARFDAVDKRFEDILRVMDTRFEAVDKRFEAVDKRFESVDKRFNDLIHHMDKRFSTMQWVMGLGFTLLAGLLAVFNFF